MTAQQWLLPLAGLAFAATGVLVPLLVRGWARLRTQATDQPLDQPLRRVGAAETPRVGGVGIGVGFGLVLLFAFAGTSELSAVHQLLGVNPLTGALLGAGVCGAVGLWDDLVGLRAKHKLAGHVLAAAIAVSYGLRWPAVEWLTGSAWIATGVTLVFLVAATNAINLIDGLDGLAAGLLAMPLALVLTSTLIGAEMPAIAVVSAVALGALLGFAVHNVHPARAFMGDSGAYAMGFLTAALLLSVEPVRVRVPWVRVGIPLLALAVPLTDVALAVGRRALRGQPIFGADADHLHHRLLGLGLGHAQVVRHLWMAAAVFVALAYAIVIAVDGWVIAGLTGMAAGAGAVGLGLHRALARLPVFGREGRRWRRQRAAVVVLLENIDGLRSLEGSADDRIRNATAMLHPCLLGLGVARLEVERAGARIAGVGEDDGAWATLSFALSPGHRAHLTLRSRIPEFRPEHWTLIDRAMASLAKAIAHPPTSEVAHDRAA